MTITNTGSELEYKPAIEINKVAESVTYSADTIRSTLRAEKESLILKRQGKVSKRDLAINAFQSIPEYKNKWMVQKSIDGMYYVSGNGLGWSGEKLIYGKWMFNPETGQIKPLDSPSIALLNVLVAN